MRVAVLHNVVDADAGPDVRDVLDQVEHVAAALERLGHEVRVLPCSLDLGEIARWIELERPDVVFNLVESLGGHDRLIHVVPALLDTLGVPFTGSPFEAVFITTSKLLTKERLWAAGLPSPPVLAVWPDERPLAAATRPPPEYDRVILKPVWDHGSPTLDDGSVVAAAAPAHLRTLLEGRPAMASGGGFAEPYVEGRELNLSLVAGGPGRAPIVLPPAEILFTGYPEGKPRIVGRDAKWSTDSFEYRSTPRRFEFPGQDRPLLAELTRLARAVWCRLGTAGYARVDFRVDAEGQPWILEVNVNPCLAPDAGFAAALEAGEMRYSEAVERILDDALERFPEPGSRRPRPRPVAV